MADLIILHGPPASGKLTTAKQISAVTGAAVFHNHLTLNVAKSFLDFGTPEFWQLVEELRVVSLNTYFEVGGKPLVFTWCYEDHAKDARFLETLNKIAIKNSGRILPVFLKCSSSCLEGRVANPERKIMDKLCTVESLQECLSNSSYAAIPYDNCLEIDSGSNTPEYNAQSVVEAFNL